MNHRLFSYTEPFRIWMGSPVAITSVTVTSPLSHHHAAPLMGRASLLLHHHVAPLVQRVPFPAITSIAAPMTIAATTLLPRLRSQKHCESGKHCGTAPQPLVRRVWPPQQSISP